MSLFDRMLVTLWKYGVRWGCLTILQVALPTVFLVGSERFWTCVCLRMRVGNTGQRVWWTNSTRCSASASSPSSASSRATSLTFIWQCPQSRQRASTTASWSSCGRHTGRSSSKVGKRVSPPKRRVSGTRPEGGKGICNYSISLSRKFVVCAYYFLETAEWLLSSAVVGIGVL